MTSGDITQLIHLWQQGDRAAEKQLFDTLYDRLHRMAVQCVRTERPGDSLGATALVHEAYLRFRKSEPIEFTSREHFLALTARVMRRILVDRARARHANKREGQPAPVELADLIVRTDGEADQILDIDRALTSLASQYPRQCSLVELRYFAGFSLEESAGILGIHVRTARRDWQVARTRLKGALDGSHP